MTLLYGDYLLSVRVLGFSLRLSGTQREMIVLCTEEISLESRKILEHDGWTVKSIKTLSSPYKNYYKRFDKVFTKLLIWTLIEYRRIVYLDSDTLVYANIDELFHCGKFCAAYRHSDLFNSGVLVVKPDLQEYRELISKIGIYPSYDGADEGFLNYYYHSLLFAPMFNASNPHNQEEPMRLPAGYNADVGQYYAHTHRFFPLSDFKILHHTLGPVKPWKWWAYPIFDLNWHWVQLRDNLQPSTDSPIGVFLAAAVNTLPIMILFGLRHFKVTKSTRFAILKHQGSLFHSILTMMFPLSCLLGFCVVPGSMHPHYAIPTFCLWTIFFLCLFCLLIHLVSTSQEDNFPSSKSMSLIGILLFIPLVVPLYIPSFLTRVCVFLILIMLCFVCSHFILRMSLAQI